MPPSLKELITKYEINVIRIDEQANPDFDPVDMFLRLNESPCTIGKNTFEMWNSFDITQTIDEIKEIAKYDLWKQLGNNMKEEELVTVLAYMDYKKVNIENCSKFFRIHLYTENRDQVDERIEFKMSINNKGEITHFLEMLVPGSKEENIFLECLEEVKRFVNKMKILSDGDSSQLIRIFNPYLSVARRGGMKDFYVMWLLFQTIDNHVIKTYRLQLLDDLERIFKLMKKMPKGKAEDFFMDNMIAFIEKYQEHAVAV